MNIPSPWNKLYEYLDKCDEPVAILTDEEIQFDIVKSEDKIRPYPLDFDDSSYTIRKMAKDAGYGVSVHPLNKRIKIFTKIP